MRHIFNASSASSALSPVDSDDKQIYVPGLGGTVTAENQQIPTDAHSYIQAMNV